MEKVSPDYHLDMAVTLTDFVNYFISRGADEKQVQEMFTNIIKSIYEDKESLKWLSVKGVPFDYMVNICNNGVLT